MVETEPEDGLSWFTEFVKMEPDKAELKTPRDLTEASLSDAGLSIVAALVMMLLFGMEHRIIWICSELSCPRALPKIREGFLGESLRIAWQYRNYMENQKNSIVFLPFHENLHPLM